jgi:hypothetical protein
MLTLFIVAMLSTGCVYRQSAAEFLTPDAITIGGTFDVEGRGIEMKSASVQLRYDLR